MGQVSDHNLHSHYSHWKKTHTLYNQFYEDTKGMVNGDDELEGKKIYEGLEPELRKGNHM